MGVFNSGNRLGGDWLRLLLSTFLSPDADCVIIAIYLGIMKEVNAVVVVVVVVVESLEVAVERQWVMANA